MWKLAGRRTADGDVLLRRLGRLLGRGASPLYQAAPHGHARTVAGPALSCAIRSVERRHFVFRNASRAVGAANAAAVKARETSCGYAEDRRNTEGRLFRGSSPRFRTKFYRTLRSPSTVASAPAASCASCWRVPPRITNQDAKCAGHASGSPGCRRGRPPLGPRAHSVASPGRSYTSSRIGISRRRAVFVRRPSRISHRYSIACPVSNLPHPEMLRVPRASGSKNPPVRQV